MCEIQKLDREYVLSTQCLTTRVMIGGRIKWQCIHDAYGKSKESDKNTWITSPTRSLFFLSRFFLSKKLPAYYIELSAFSIKLSVFWIKLLVFSIKLLAFHEKLPALYEFFKIEFYET